MFMAAPDDFELGKAEAVDPERLLSDPCWTLYCLDLDASEALFVQTPEDLDLTAESFLFQAQFKHAFEVIRLGFERFHHLASEIRVDSKKWVFVHSVGRCGSTLMSQLFRTVPGVCSVSEPDPPTQITEWRGRQLLEDRELQALAESSTRFCGKAWPGRAGDTRWVIKYRAQCIEIVDWLMQAFPGARQLFMRRQPIDWLESVFRAFIDGTVYRDPSFIALFEEVWARNFPLIRRQQVVGKPMSVAKTWMYVWIAVRLSQARHQAAGYPFHPIDYEALKTDPESCLRAAFAFCDIRVEDWTSMRSCLKTDSQAGTLIAQDAVKDLDRRVPEDGRDEALALLRQWGFFQTPPEPLPQS